MGMTPEQAFQRALGAAQKYTKDCLNGLGTIAGKPCTIKSTKEVETGTQVVFEWTGNDGTTQTTTIVVPNGVDGQQGKQGEKGETGEPGNGIVSISKIATADNVDTYQILYSNGTTFNYTVNNATVKTKLSEFINDEEFIKRTVSNLINYYTKTDVYSKSEIDTLLQNIGAGLGVLVVTELPTADISPTTIYLIKASDDSNNYMQYMCIAGAWADLGSTEIDLSNYPTNTQLDSKLTLLATKDVVETLSTEVTNHTDNTTVHITTEERAKWNEVENKEEKANKVTVLSKDCTDEQYPSAKSVYDKISKISGGVINYIANTGALTLDLSSGSPIPLMASGNLVTITDGKYFTLKAGKKYRITPMLKTNCVGDDWYVYIYLCDSNNKQINTILARKGSDAADVNEPFTIIPTVDTTYYLKMSIYLIQPKWIDGRTVYIELLDDEQELSISAGENCGIYGYDANGNRKQLTLSTKEKGTILELNELANGVKGNVATWKLDDGTSYMGLDLLSPNGNIKRLQFNDKIPDTELSLWNYDGTTWNNLARYTQSSPTKFSVTPTSGITVNWQDSCYTDKMVELVVQVKYTNNSTFTPNTICKVATIPTTFKGTSLVFSGVGFDSEWNLISQVTGYTDSNCNILAFVPHENVAYVHIQCTGFIHFD